MQIRYKGMFEAVDVPSVVFATKHPGLDENKKPIKIDMERTRTIYQGEVATIVEGDPRGLLEQEDNFEPVDAAAKSVRKQIEEDRKKAAAPDQPIFDAVTGVGGVQ